MSTNEKPVFQTDEKVINELLKDEEIRKIAEIAIQVSPNSMQNILEYAKALLLKEQASKNMV